MGARIECIDELELEAATQNPNAVAEALRQRLADELEASRDRPDGTRLRQEDIAAITGKDQTTVSRYVRGLALPDLEFLRRYEEFLGLARGTFAARAGYFTQAQTFPEAIATVPGLSEHGRELVTRAYEGALGYDSGALGEHPGDDGSLAP